MIIINKCKYALSIIQKNALLNHNHVFDNCVTQAVYQIGIRAMYF